MPTKNYAVAIHDHVREELGDVFTLLLHKSGDQYYFLAHHIEPNGNYFFMKLRYVGPDEVKSEMEVQLPHQYIKYVLGAADIKTLGFTA